MCNEKYNAKRFCELCEHLELLFNENDKSEKYKFKPKNTNVFRLILLKKFVLLFDH